MNSEKFEAHTELTIQKLPVLVHSFDKTLLERFDRLQQASAGFIKVMSFGLLGLVLFKNFQELVDFVFKKDEKSDKK